MYYVLNNRSYNLLQNTNYMDKNVFFFLFRMNENNIYIRYLERSVNVITIRLQNK